MTRIKKIHDITVHGVGNKTVSMMVSAFGNVDFQGDRVVKGAFDKSINKWRDSGRKVPFIWSHDWNNPMAHIGTVDPFKIRETENGLIVEAELDEDTDFAKQVLKLLRERRVTEASFAYDVVKERPGEDKANDLLELDIIECGPTLKGANSRTELLDVKSAQALFESEAKKPTAKALDDYVRWGTPGWHDRHVAYMQTGEIPGSSTATVRSRKSCGCSSLQLCDEHAAKLNASRKRKLVGTTRNTKCPTCRKGITVEVRKPVPGGRVPWAISDCHGAILGWSGKMSREDHVKEMAIVRDYVGPASEWMSTQRYKTELEAILADWSPESRKYERVGGHEEIRAINAELARLDPNTKKIRSDISDRRLEEKIRMTYNQDIIARLDALDPAGAKHSARAAEAAFNAVRDAIAVADGARDRIGALNSLKRQLEENVLRILRTAATSLAAEALDQQAAAGHAIQGAQSMLGVAELVRQSGYGDVATDLEAAASKVIDACNVLASHWVATESGKMMVPEFDSNFVVREEAPVPVVSGERYRLDVAGVVDSTVTEVAGEGTTYRIAINEVEDE